MGKAPIITPEGREQALWHGRPAGLPLPDCPLSAGFAVRHLKLFALLVVIAVQAGCGGYSEQKKEMALESTLSQYHTAMRWGHWQTLRGLRGSKAPAVPDIDLENIRVTGYEIVQPPLPVDETKVLQAVEIEYVLKDSQRLRRLRDDQEWRHDAETGQWQVYSPFPDFR
jgi:hypothetical protein